MERFPGYVWLVSRISLQVPGSVSAPGQARRRVLGVLDGALPSGVAGDVGLLVSELVTNSVRHSRVGDGAIGVELLLLAGLLRLTVSDPGGGSVPQLAASGPERPGGLGLVLVDAIASSWGVIHEPDGVVRVWCEIRLDSPDPLADAA